MMIRILSIIALVVCCSCVPIQASAQEDGALVLTRFDEGLTYGFLSWQKAYRSVDDGVLIKAKDTKGGGGLNFQGDASAFVDGCPALSLLVNEGNKAKGLRLVIGDRDGTRHEYSLRLPSQAGPALLRPISGASLGEPDKMEKPGEEPGFNAADIGSVLIIGDWRADPVDIIIKELRMLPADEQMLADRAAAREKAAKEAERRARQEAQHKARIEELLAGGAAHGEGQPTVQACYAAARDIIAVVIQERQISKGGTLPYEAQEGDEIVPKDKPVVVWRDGQLVEEHKGFELKRGKRKVGDLSPDRQRFFHSPTATGAWLTTETMAETAAYLVDGKEPSAVSVKRKPNAYRSEANRTVIYLQLAEDLEEGRDYHISFRGINTAQEETRYRHDSRSTRSESVHVSHIGFRPDDPQKLGRISLWLGSGGHCNLADGKPLRCALLDERDGSAVWEGEAQQVRRHDEPDQLRDKRNLAKTDVYGVDFSDVSRPGSYRLWVEGIGCSHPFPIDEDAWLEAFRISMQGLLSHRSGIALPKDLMGYERPRNMHPADGVRVLPIDLTMMHGESDAVARSYKAMLASGQQPQAMPQAWGGYMDAGDWDRRSQHLKVTGLLLELYEVNPDFWAETDLVVPAEERANDLPDLLDEVLWNLSFYHRLQEADGGVRGGIESTSHPRPAESSWQESLGLGCFAPDPASSLRFAAVAAQYARLAKDVDAARAAALGRAARKAWDWSQGPEAQAVLDSFEGKDADKKRDEVIGERSLAAVQLLALSADIERYQPIISAALADATAAKVETLAYHYARLPAELADAALQEQCRNIIIELADTALAFQRGNAWGLASSVPNLSHMGYVGYLSVPGMISRALPRAWLLTGNERYLAGAVTSCGFAAGGNPDNRAYTTGLGPDPVRWPLHIDSLQTGQDAPRGITIYGPGDPAANFGFEKWVHQWYVNSKQSMPVGKQWPFAEAYWDIYTVPANNEYTVHQTIGPTAYTWGLLAVRDR